MKRKFQILKKNYQIKNMNMKKKIKLSKKKRIKLLV